MTNEEIELIRSGTWQGLILYYNYLFADRGWTFPNHMIPVAKALCDERIRYILIIIGPGSSKSQTISVCYPSMEIGRNPDTTFMNISAGEALPQSFCRSIMEIIESSPVFHAVFPDVKPDKDAGWSLDRGLFVTGRKPGIPDATYKPYGLMSKELTGKHAKVLLIDDIHDKENSSSAYQIEKVKDIFFENIMGRGDPMGARYIVAGRRWAIDDIYGILKKTEEFVTIEIPFMRDGEKVLYADVEVPDKLFCCFTEGNDS